MVRNFWLIWIMFFYVFFYNITNFRYIYILFYYIVHLISYFLYIRSLLVPCVYVSIGSIDCILLSSFEFKAILSVSSVKTLCLSRLDLCCVFNISLLFLINSLRSFLLSQNLSLFPMTHFYEPFAFLSSSSLSFK